MRTLIEIKGNSYKDILDALEEIKAQITLDKDINSSESNCTYISGDNPYEYVYNCNSKMKRFKWE